MADIIYGNDADFRAYLHPEIHPGTYRFIERQFDRFKDRPISDSLRRFVDAAKDRFESFRDSRATRAARIAVRHGDVILGDNRVVPLVRLEDIRSASPRMQELVMTEPGLRSRYNEQRCYGYGDTYRPRVANVVGEQDPVYCEIMNGVVHDSGDDLEYTLYFDNLEEAPYMPLVPYEQTLAVRLHERIREVMAGGDDPSDLTGGRL